MRIIQSSDLTPDMLTDLLIACGVLRAGSVTAVSCDMESSQKGFISTVAIFNVTYSRDAEGELPQCLFLKVTKSDLHAEYRQVGHYYAQLLRHGVSAYSWDDCWNDYRASVIVMTLIPIGQFRRQMPAGVIWYGMEQSAAAFNDLPCAELL